MSEEDKNPVTNAIESSTLLCRGSEMKMEEKIIEVKSCSRCAFQRRSPHGGGQKECAITNCNRSANYASKVADHCPLKTTKYSWIAT